MQKDDSMTVEEACAFLGVSRNTLYRYAFEHPQHLKNYRQGRFRMFDRNAVQKFREIKRELTQL